MYVVRSTALFRTEEPAIPRWSRLWSCVFLIAAVSACSATPELTPRQGRYVGDQVSFRLSGTTISDIRLSGIECRVPHPDNPVLALCLERAPGVASESIKIVGLTIGAAVGDVRLDGTFDGAGNASGNWEFATECGLSEQPCVSDGAWSATWREPLITDTYVPDAAGEIDSGPSDLGPDPGPDIGTDTPLGPPAPPEATVSQKAAHNLVLDRRQRAGVAGFQMDTAINTAAQAHADYFSAHVSEYQASGLSPHRQNVDWTEGFTGVTVGDRLSAAGAGAGGGGAYEVMAFSNTTGGAIDGWMDTLYHRIPLIHPNATQWGYGEVIGGASCQVGDVLYGPAQTTIAKWPASSATGVDLSWNGLESPQPPLPAGESYPSGPVVTVSFGHSVGALSQAALTVKASGAEVPVMSRDPSDDSWLSSTWSLYALDPLTPNTTYVVSFAGLGAVPQTWEFTTRP